MRISPFLKDCTGLPDETGLLFCLCSRGTPSHAACHRQTASAREHRLYQADWLLRFYGFSAGELLDTEHPDLDSLVDPKSDWAVRNYHLFPVEINTADYEMLLRIPGIGIKSAEKIIRARRIRALDYDSLKKIGVVLKRARHFITCKGKFHGRPFKKDYQLRLELMPYHAAKSLQIQEGEQLSFFSQILPQSEHQKLFLVRAGEV